MQFDRQITITTAGNHKSTNWLPQVLTWGELVEKFRTPVRSTESLAQFLALPKGQQDELKDVGGFVAGTLSGPRRKANAVTGRDVITLDLDNIAASGTITTLRIVDGLGCAYAVYSTRKHSELTPRLRVLLPLNRNVTADEYEPIARRLAQYIGLNLCDPTTFEASRLMYWPSVSCDSQYVFTFADRPFVDADGILRTFSDWRNVAEWPVVPGTAQAQQRLVDKQGDPTEKPGVVGAFCRVYNIYSAIEKYLPNTYAPCDDGDRFTYTGGSTTGGAVIYDDGNFLYSHHATDPCSGKLVNAFDLVRLHLFTDKDDEAKPGTPSNKLPSFLAMCEKAVADQDVAALIDRERYNEAVKDFAAQTGMSYSVGENDIAWTDKLSRNADRKIEKTAPNIKCILQNDPEFRGKIQFNEFLQETFITGPLPWKSPTSPRKWSDSDDNQCQIYLEAMYRIASPTKFAQALDGCAKDQAFHPVRDYLFGLQWDGVQRLDALFIDYLGAADTPFIRAAARKSFTAAVARVMTPGVKYDTMPVLIGRQGRGKSTLLSKMGRAWFSDSLTTFEGKEAMEGIQGKWIIEIAELQAMNRAELNSTKGFMSKTSDTFRAAYGRHTQTNPRQCVFFGTTNTADCLRDPTGNRRFWPIDIDMQERKKDVFHDLNENEIGQIWAEAVMRWNFGETLYLSGNLEKDAQEQQEAHREADPFEGPITEFVEKPIPKGWIKWTLDQRRVYWGGSNREDTELVERDRVCALEIWCELFGKSKADLRQRETRQINQVLERLPGWQRNTPAPAGPDYGSQRGFTRKGVIQS